MEWLPIAVSVVAALFSLMAARLLGQNVEKLNEISSHIKELEGRLWVHLTTPSSHEAGFARTDQQILNLTKAIAEAHTRIERVEEVVHGKS